MLLIKYCKKSAEIVKTEKINYYQISASYTHVRKSEGKVCKKLPLLYVIFFHFVVINYTPIVVLWDLINKSSIAHGDI